MSRRSEIRELREEVAFLRERLAWYKRAYFALLFWRSPRDAAVAAATEVEGLKSQS